MGEIYIRSISAIGRPKCADNRKCLLGSAGANSYIAGRFNYKQRGACRRSYVKQVGSGAAGALDGSKGGWGGGVANANVAVLENAKELCARGRCYYHRV